MASAKQAADMEAVMDAMARDQAEKTIRTQKLMDDNPGLPFLSAYVMASDYVGMERTQKEVEAGEHSMTVTLPILVGSYARIDFIQWLHDEGHIDRDTMLDWFRDNWTGADPNDTDPRFLAHWRTINQRWRKDGPGTPYYRDSDKYLPAVTGKVRVYRGQRMSDKTGFAWSLQQRVAQKFAVSGGGRAPVKDGLIIMGHVRPHDVLAYLTSRGEDEVIVDPANVR
jgi:hypothetical protein